MHQPRVSRSASQAVRTCLVYLVLCTLLAIPQFATAQAATPADDKSGDTSSTAASQAVSLGQLADIIENDKTREALVADLRKSADAQTPAAAMPSKTDDAALDHAPTTNDPVKGAIEGQKIGSEEHVSFARRFAQTTAAWSETIGARVSKTWDTLSAVVTDSGKKSKSAVPFNTSVFLAAAVTLALVVVSTAVAFLVLRLIASQLFSRINRFASKNETGSAFVIRRGTAISMAVLVDVVVVFLAGGAGYLAGLYAIGDAGTMGTRESLFINAFMLIELSKVVIRAFFAARYNSLRLLNIPADIAGWWSIRLRVFVSVIGYGVLVAVPIVNAQLSFFMGAALSFLIMGGAYIYALMVIFGNRKLLTARLMQKAEETEVGFFGVLYRLLARLWILIALVYFTVLFVSSQLDPTGALPYMMSATFQTVIAAAVGAAVSGLLGRAIGRRLTFSDALREKLPMFETRVNSYVPTGLKVIRVVILIIVAAVIANAWAVFNLQTWLASDAGLKTVSIAVKVAIILSGAALLWLVTASVIEHRLSPATGGGAPSARQQTLLVLFRNALAILFATFTVMITLSQIGVDIGPLIAGAGVFGLAIGFGAQSLVKDIITGVFIQLENAMNTGDVVSVGGITGTAERLTIRSVSIRDIDGAYHIVPFSAATVVSNYMRDWAYFRTEYQIAYREDIDNAIYYLREAFAELKADPVAGGNILEDMTVPGVTALGDSAVNIRIMIKTTPGTQWGVGRAMNRLVKMHFDRAGIEIPFPHQTLWFGEDRDGKSPAANLRVIEGDTEDQPRALKQRRCGDDAAPSETGDAPS